MHLQDRLLIAESLVAFAGDVRDPSPRGRRAWELATRLLAEDDLHIDALVEEVDEHWAGPTRR